MINKKVRNGSTVKYWDCMNFSKSLQESTVCSFCNQLIQMCPISGTEFKCEPVIPIYSVRSDQVENAFKYVYNAALIKIKGKELKFLIAILPDNNGSLYGRSQGCLDMTKMSKNEASKTRAPLVTLATLIGRELRGEKIEKPLIRQGQAASAKKGEDSQ